MLGTITFFTGPMSCGKSEQLISWLKRYRARRMPTVCLQPTKDTRADAITSRNGLTHESVRVDQHDAGAVRAAIGDAHVVGIDELHFFPPGVIAILVELMRGGRTILLSGLDTDFRGIPYPISVELMKLPEVDIVRMRAICEVCRADNATRSQRLVNGHPASSDDPVELVDDAAAHDARITYEPRCMLHHVVR